MQGRLLEAVVEEIEFLGPLLAQRALEGAHFGLVDLPGTLDLFVEAQLAADWNRSKHWYSMIENKIAQSQA